MDRSIHINKDTCIHYLEFGKGEPLVLVPSLWVTSLSYERLGQELAKHYHVFIPDLNKTKSTFRKEIRSFDGFVDLLHQCILVFHITRFYLVGASLSGFYCTKYLHSYPEFVKKMFVISSSPVGVEIPHKKLLLITGYMKLLTHNMTSWIGWKTNMLWFWDSWLYARRHPKQFIFEGLVATGEYGEQPLSLPIPSKLLFAKRDEFIPGYLLEHIWKVKNLETEIIDGYHGWYFFHENVLVDKIVSFFQNKA